MAKLGVNVDHVATLRQARRTYEPDPAHAAAVCEFAGADSLTLHLREDRRHVQDRDLRLIRETAHLPLNLEMGLSHEILSIALQSMPDQATIVPERREEVTTEGGLDAAGRLVEVSEATGRLAGRGIRVSLFIEAEERHIRAAAQARAHAVEFHTGAYSLAHQRGAGPAVEELERLAAAATLARELGLVVNMGHGLNYRNITDLVSTVSVNEYNIGHAIISRALFVGLERAVAEMKRLIG
ncbi:MAG: pyridoxine 5'-phosphate synthase [Planctomycetes bacterium]|nr:pyridoxine 5'-phosphate synthase [Planctomycetota bacterium]